MRVAGVDGTKKGWVAVVLEDGRFLRDVLIQTIDSNFDELDDAQVIAIDVPIGFGPRAADSAARKLLVGSASTVFTTPGREVLERTFGPGLGVSAQAHALGPRIIHVTQLASRNARVYEVHPEIAFRAMNRVAHCGTGRRARAARSNGSSSCVRRESTWRASASPGQHRWTTSWTPGPRRGLRTGLCVGRPYRFRRHPSGAMVLTLRFGTEPASAA